MGKAHPVVDIEALLARIEASVRTHGAVPRKDLPSLKRHLPALAPHLVAKGYEIGSTVRRPLEAQLLELAAGGFLPMKGLERRVAGASAREVKEGAGRLVQRGELVLVVRESGPGLVGRASETLDRSDLAEILRCLTKVQRLVRRASAKKGSPLTVLREDVAAPLSRWAASPGGAPRRETKPAAPSETLTGEIRRRLLESRLPLRVPDLLRELGATAEEGKRALLDGAARGWFELSPESGMGRLSREDAELCPTGPMGTRLSWVVAREHKGVN
jgi:hypothetical protein